MVSTITAAALTVTITESIELNGKDQGGTNTLSIASINEISKRILTITTNESTIATFSGAVASAGHYNDSAVKYMRFTYKDDTYFITLTFRNQDNDEVAIKVDAGQSFIWCGDNDNGIIWTPNICDPFNQPWYRNYKYINGYFYPIKIN